MLWMGFRMRSLNQRPRYAAILALFALCVLLPVFCATQESHGLEPSFRFQNGFWVNLHATLRGEARRRSLNLAAQMNVDLSIRTMDEGTLFLIRSLSD
jgi:hypothetical protein